MGVEATDGTAIVSFAKKHEAAVTLSFMTGDTLKSYDNTVAFQFGKVGEGNTGWDTNYYKTKFAESGVPLNDHDFFLSTWSTREGVQPSDVKFVSRVDIVSPNILDIIERLEKLEGKK